MKCVESGHEHSTAYGVTERIPNFTLVFFGTRATCPFHFRPPSSQKPPSNGDQAEAPKQRAAQEAQWTGGNALVVNGHPKPGCDGVYVRAGTDADGAPFGRNIVSGFVLCFAPSGHMWCIAQDITTVSQAMFSCVACVDASAARVPEGAHTWQCFNLIEMVPTTVSVARVPEAEARRRNEVC